VPHGVDLSGHAASLGALAESVASLAELEAAVRRAQDASRTTVIVVTTDPAISTAEGGHWWDVAIPAVSTRQEVQTARANYETAIQARDER
jgi:3D-(3,5/4)-trihydroxycyclohexane-1,2-dione acylhydrolase (decyclizing)